MGQDQAKIKEGHQLKNQGSCETCSGQNCDSSGETEKRCISEDELPLIYYRLGVEENGRDCDVIPEVKEWGGEAADELFLNH